MSSEDDEAQPLPVRREVPNVEIDENFYYCCATNCWQRIPCAEHQAEMFANPQLFCQSAIQGANENEIQKIPAIVGTLHRWAVWTLRQNDENKFIRNES